MQIGYARVSTYEQNLSLQKDALKKAGCKRVFEDQVSGVAANRPGLETAMSHLRDSDILVVWRLDRLGRSLKELISLVELLKERKVGFRSLQESIDTTNAGGMLIFQIFGALAEFERNLIRERTQAGLTAARARGRQGGRPKKLDKKQIELARKLYNEKNHSVGEICQVLGISKPTLYSYLRETSSGIGKKNNKESL